MSKIAIARALCIAGFVLCSAGLSSCIRLAPTGEYACEDDGDCDDGERCKAMTGGGMQCQRHCDSNADCAFPNGCLIGTCVPPSRLCYSPDSCLGYTCNVAGLCNVACNSSSECSAGYTCMNNLCRYEPSSGFSGIGGYGGFAGVSGG